MIFRGILTGVTHAERVQQLRTRVADLLAEGYTREEIVAALDLLRPEMRQANPADEDVVLDVMDFLTGWSAPHARM